MSQFSSQMSTKALSESKGSCHLQKIDANLVDWSFLWVQIRLSLYENVFHKYTYFSKLQ